MVMVIISWLRNAVCMIQPQHKRRCALIYLVPHAQDAPTSNFRPNNHQTSRNQTDPQHHKGKQEHRREKEQQHRDVAHEEEEDHERDQDCHWQGVLPSVQDPKLSVVGGGGGH